MSNFKCNQCNKEIIENEQGVYVTGCEHYPVDECNCDDYNGYVCERCKRQQVNMTVADYEKELKKANEKIKEQKEMIETLSNTLMKDKDESIF